MISTHRFQDVDPALFPHCYLVTPPRFLNLPLFNGVSTWYLYTKDRKLGALIVEVHNSSQERHNYFLHEGLPCASNLDTRLMPTAERSEFSDGTQFRCDKVFHVSAFGPRNDATYTTRVVDPLRLSGPATGSIDMTITMASDTGPSRFVSRLRSTDDPIDPSAIGFFQKVFLLLICFQIELLAFPRAIWQMLWMHLVKKMPTFSYSEPKKESIARPGTKDEMFLESVFRDFLRDKVSAFPEPLTVQYTSAGETQLNPERSEIFASSNPSDSQQAESVSLSVLTPVFYKRLVQHDSVSKAIQAEFLDAPSDKRTLHLENEALLFRILASDQSIQRSASSQPATLTQRLLLALRDALTTPSTSPTSPPSAIDSGNQTHLHSPKHHKTDLDTYVLTHRPDVRTRYLKTTIWIRFTRRSNPVSYIWIALLALFLGIVLATVQFGSSMEGAPNAMAGYSLITGSVVYWSLFVTKDDLASLLLI
ncbi:MAG: hypothetical protein Q9162_003636 [Coniocarpon cinnabarinum]